MPLIKDGRIIADRWVSVRDGEEIPADAPAIVTLARWRAEEGLSGRVAPLGVRLASDEAPEDIADDLRRFELIALEFPKFTDGRAYSHARVLRERYGYRGELRAVGNVLRDQLLFMLRCGFDTFEIASETAADDWRAAIEEIGLFYQPAADGRKPIAAFRRPNAISQRVAMG